MKDLDGLVGKPDDLLPVIAPVSLEHVLHFDQDYAHDDAAGQSEGVVSPANGDLKLLGDLIVPLLVQALLRLALASLHIAPRLLWVCLADGGCVQCRHYRSAVAEFAACDGATAQ